MVVLVSWVFNEKAFPTAEKTRWIRVIDTFELDSKCLVNHDKLYEHIAWAFKPKV